MRKIFIVLVFAFGLVVSDGCRHNVSTNPAVVHAISANDASKLVKTVSDGLTAADKTLDSIQSQDPEYYVAAKAWLVKIAKANDVAANNILAYNNGTLTFDKVVPSLQNIATIGQQFDPTIFGFKNPDTQTKVKVGFQLLQATLASVIQQFGNK